MNKKKAAVGQLIYGVNPIIEVLKAKRRKMLSIYTTKQTPKAWREIEVLLPKYVQIQYVSRDVLTKMAEGGDHQGVVGWVHDFPYRSKPFDPQRQSLIAVLDGIQDVRNLGAILRSAYCAGVNGVIIPQKNAAPLNAVAFKSSAGLAEHLEIMRVPNMVEAVKQLQSDGYAIFTTSFDGKNATTISYKEPVAVIIGSEGEGVSAPVAKMGTAITLPQRSGNISYNASVAAGILFFLIATTLKKV